jgi:large subunit ribosomal protein L10
MNRDQKAAVVDELADEIREAEAVFAIDYRGISVPQAAELRTRLRDADAHFRIVKNSLTERAADKAGAESLREYLEGPTALTFVRGDAAMAAKALSDMARATRLLDFKGGTMNGGALTADDIRAIARLPSRDVLYGQLVGVVASPVGGLARGLQALLSGIAVALGQIRDEGKIGGGADEAAEPAAESDPARDDAPAPSLEAGPDTEAPETPETPPATSPSAPEGEDTPSETETPEEDQ